MALPKEFKFNWVCAVGAALAALMTLIAMFVLPWIGKQPVLWLIVSILYSLGWILWGVGGRLENKPIVVGGSLVPTTMAVVDPWFGVDKFLHLMVCYFLSMLGFAVAFRAGASVGVSVLVGAVLVLVVGAIKEAVDKKRGGIWSWKDLTYDAIGAIIGLSLIATHTGLL